MLAIIDKLEQPIGVESKALDIIDKVAVDKGNGARIPGHTTGYKAIYEHSA